MKGRRREVEGETSTEGSPSAGKEIEGETSTVLCSLKNPITCFEECSLCCLLQKHVDLGDSQTAVYSPP